MCLSSGDIGISNKYRLKLESQSFLLIANCPVVFSNGSTFVQFILHISVKGEEINVFLKYLDLLKTLTI